MAGAKFGALDRPRVVLQTSLLEAISVDRHPQFPQINVAGLNRAGRTIGVGSGAGFIGQW
jgi:hypothetical protein